VNFLTPEMVTLGQTVVHDTKLLTVIHKIVLDNFNEKANQKNQNYHTNAKTGQSWGKD